MCGPVGECVYIVCFAAKNQQPAAGRSLILDWLTAPAGRPHVRECFSAFCPSALLNATCVALAAWPVAVEMRYTNHGVQLLGRRAFNLFNWRRATPRANEMVMTLFYAKFHYEGIKYNLSLNL